MPATADNAIHGLPVDNILRSLARSPLLRDAFMVLQAFTIPAAFWFRPICVGLAVSWLVYRAYQVLKTPLDNLAFILGFDIPSTPTLDLAGIKADGVIIHWATREKQRHKSTLRYDIHLNGSIIDTVPSNESAVMITGLQPSSYYVVRVALVNHLDFSSRSTAIRFRTKSATSAEFFGRTQEHQDADQEPPAGCLPRVRHYTGLKNVLPASTDLTVVNRDNTGPAGKRNSLGRRATLADNTSDGRVIVDADPEMGSESLTTLQKLTEKLDSLRNENDEIERQAKEEEDEEFRLKEDLGKERDILKAEVLEKEKASRNLKREVNTLERQNTAAQNERSKQERLLQQKKNERQKLKNDVVLWAREANEMRSDADKISIERQKLLEQSEQAKETLRLRQAEELTAVHALDDEIRSKTTEMKKIERLIKNSSPNGAETESSLVQQFQQEAEEDRRWASYRIQLHNQYSLAVQKLESSKNFHAEQARYLASLRADRRRQDDLAQYASPPGTQERQPRTEESQGRRRAHSGHSSDSPRITTFPMSSGGAFGGNLTSIAPFGSATFLNIQNGMTISGLPHDISMSDEDKDRLTGGALMSPSAGAELLPADLFLGDDDRKHSANHVLPLPGLGALPGLPGVPAAVTQNSFSDHPGPGLASPASGGSRSPSIFASPRGSSYNLQLSSPEHNTIDADRRSVRSTRSGRGTAGSIGQSHATGSRFSNLFNIKARHKANSIEDGLAFGQAQSHSVPKQDPSLVGITSFHRKRNSSVSGPSTEAALASEGMSSDTRSTSRKSALGAFFGRDRGDGWPTTFTNVGRRPTSPRPVSTHSNELPRPSADSNRWGIDAWPTGDASSGTRSSPLSFGPGFSISQQPRIYGSRHPSRRPSVQYGASGPPEDILEDDDLDVTSPLQPLPPIGTRPDRHVPTEHVEDNVKLNPAAKDFKSFLASMSIRGKDRNKGGSSDRTTSTLPVVSAIKDSEMDDSPPNSRKSRDTRDTRSLATTESSVLESGRNSHDLARTPSYSASDAPVPSPLIGSVSSIGKESFMQKITRKSSSGKFSLPTFKREKNKLDPSSAATSPAISRPPADDGEESLSASFSSLTQRDARESNRQSIRGWGNVLKIGKRKGNETPSLSSMASIDDDDDEDDVDQMSGTKLV